MMNLLLITLLVSIMTTAASAQQSPSRQFYDSTGKRIGGSSTDSQGTVTNYDARGKVISRESTTGNTTTIYDSRGRNVGKTTTSPKR